GQLRARLHRPAVRDQRVLRPDPGALRAGRRPARALRGRAGGAALRDPGGDRGRGRDRLSAVPAYEPIPLGEIEGARSRIAGTVVRTPLLRLQHDGDGEIYLKLENLQPIGSFKLRGAGNAMALADPELVAAGVWTASAGNMAQAVAWHARERGVRCRVVVPDTAPRAKLDAIVRLGAEPVEVPPATWWEVFTTRSYPGMEGLFLHAFSD